MGTIFMVSALLAVLNGVYIYVTSWSSPQVMAMASYGFKVAPVSHLERTVAVFLITFAVLNAWAAFYGSKSFRMLTSFLNMIVVTHYFIEVWVGAYTGYVFLAIACGSSPRTRSPSRRTYANDPPADSPSCVVFSFYTSI